METLVVGGAAFLAAVLWFDLMFDAQVRGHRGEELPEPVLSSIAGYYARVTTGARPMNRVVAAAMVATLVGLAGELADDDTGIGWVLASALLAVPPIALAAIRVVPSAVRLGRRSDDPTTQSALARRIYRDHVYCEISIVALLAVQGVLVAIR